MAEKALQLEGFYWKLSDAHGFNRRADHREEMGP